MPATRTQIYLTIEQRERIDRVMEREHKSLAQVVREALDAYLPEAQPEADKALQVAFGSMPELSVPSRDEWERDKAARRH